MLHMPMEPLRDVPLEKGTIMSGMSAAEVRLLLDSAIAKVKGNVADKKAFGAALKAADFKSVRGDFKFGNNHFPVQDMHIFEVAKDAKGRVSLKTVATPLKNHTDAYAALCKM